ncbi:MAG: caspase family protein [Bacteroidota bacterium]
MPQPTRTVVKRERYEPAPTPLGKNLLLAIAIDEYTHQPRLFNAVKDAEDLVQVLTEKYDFRTENVLKLYNQEANKPQIFAALERLGEEVTDKDSLLIYYAGHGYYHERTKTGHLIPQNADANVWEYLSNADLKDNLRSINSLHTFLIVDSCFSGSLFSQSRKGLTNFDNTITTFAERVGQLASRWCLAAGMIEEVGDGIHGENSPFAKAVLSFLKTNTNGKVPASALVQHVKRVTPNNAKQTPIGGILFNMNDMGGEFIFRLKKDAATAWKYAQEVNTVVAYQNFMTAYPDNKNAETAFWKISQLRGTIAGYLTYRERFPNGVYRQAANDAIHEIEDAKAWEKAVQRNRLSTYLSYLDDFPKGQYVTLAKEKIAALQAMTRPMAATNTAVSSKETDKETTKPIITKTVTVNLPTKAKKSTSYLVYGIGICVLLLGIASVLTIISNPKKEPEPKVKTDPKDMTVTKFQYEQLMKEAKYLIGQNDYKTAKGKLADAIWLADQLNYSLQDVKDLLVICDTKLPSKTESIYESLVNRRAKLAIEQRTDDAQKQLVFCQNVWYVDENSFEYQLVSHLQDVSAPLYISPLHLNELDFSKDDATPNKTRFSTAQLNHLTTILACFERLKIELQVHTDDIGSDLDNLQLSQKRGETIKGILEKKGIASNRISVKAFGESAPLSNSTTGGARKQNRRVLVHLVDY